MSKRTMHCKHSDPLCNDCMAVLDAMSNTEPNTGGDFAKSTTEYWPTIPRDKPLAEAIAVLIAAEKTAWLKTILPERENDIAYTKGYTWADGWNGCRNQIQADADKEVRGEL